MKNDINSFNSFKSIIKKCITNFSNMGYSDRVLEQFIEQLIETYAKMLQNLNTDWPTKKKIHEDNLTMFLMIDNDFSELISKAIINSYTTNNDFLFIENLILKEIESETKNKKNDYSVISKMVNLLLDLYENNNDYEKFIQTCEKELRYCYLRYIEYLESIGKIDKAIVYCNISLSYAQGFYQYNLLIKLGDLEYKQGNNERALSYYMNVFDINPLQQKKVIEKIRKVSQSLNSWEKIKEELTAKLEQKKQYHELIEIYLKDNDLQLAYKIVFSG